MKARVLIMAMMVAFTSYANAQEVQNAQQQVEQQQVEQQQAPQRNKKIEAHVKRMTDRFLLDDAKAAKFAPLYQEYLEAKVALRPNLVCGEELTDAQIEANIEAMLNVREQSLELDKKYYKKFAKLLNAKQLDMIFGSKTHFGLRPMGHGKGAHGMSPRHYGKHGVSRDKCPKEKGCMKTHGCKKAMDCKQNCEACPEAAECKKECKLNGKCLKGEACPKAGECEKSATCEK